MYSPSYTAELPTLAADPEVSVGYLPKTFMKKGYAAHDMQAFSLYIQAQRSILAATQFVIELNKAVKENADMYPIYERMKELERFLEPLLSHCEAWLLTSTTTSPVDPTEAVVARSLRCMASIKLNR